MSEYNRMSPDERLLKKLKEYSKIDYTVDAFHLSSKEADFIISAIEALRLENEELKHELARSKELIEIADVLITNENAIKDWEDAKRFRVM